MQNYGMEYDSDESADEDFSPTNVESNSRSLCFGNDCGLSYYPLGSDDSLNESSSSSSCDDDDDDETTSSKQSAAIPSASSKSSKSPIEK